MKKLQSSPGHPTGAEVSARFSPLFLACGIWSLIFSLLGFVCSAVLPEPAAGLIGLFLPLVVTLLFTFAAVLACRYAGRPDRLSPAADYVEDRIVAGPYLILEWIADISYRYGSKR